MGIYIAILACSIIGFFIHLYYDKEPRTKKRILELLLLYQLIFSVGFSSFLAFIGFAFMPETVAAYLNWPTCPFQHELANVNLAFGVLGIMCIWYRDNFWFATIVGISIWLLADAVGHIYHAIVFQNYSPGNVGVPLITDIAVPVLLLILWYLYKKEK